MGQKIKKVSEKFPYQKKYKILTRSLSLIKQVVFVRKQPKVLRNKKRLHVHSADGRESLKKAYAII